MSDRPRPGRLRLGVLAAVLFAAGLVAAAVPAQAQNQTLSAVPGGQAVQLCATYCLVDGTATITPAGSGQLMSNPYIGLVGVWFAASPNAVPGTTVQISFANVYGGTVNVSVQIVAPAPTTTTATTNQTISATVTPVPRPGPCFVLSGSEAGFGNVELGGSWTPLASPPTISGCATISQDVLIGASPLFEVGGTSPFMNHASCTAYATCAPGANQVALGLQASERIVPQLPSQAIGFSGLAGAFPARPVDLAMRLPTQIPSTTATQLYLNVALTVVAAA